MEEKPNYYSILPANVRYDDELNSSEKVLYSEITALANKHGFCYASNSYFARLYGVRADTVSSWISDLKLKGYIDVEMEYEENSKAIKRRKIYILDTLGGIGKNPNRYKEKTQEGYPEKSQRGIGKNPKENNTRMNITRENRYHDEEVPPASMRDRVISKWNSLDKNIPRLQALTEGTSRYKYLRARINEYGLNRVLEAVDMISKSKFLQGYVTDFVINFDWFIKPNNFIKVLEGNYSDKTDEIEDMSNQQESSQQVQEPKKQESTDVEDFIERKKREWIEEVKKERSLDD